MPRSATGSRYAPHSSSQSRFNKTPPSLMPPTLAAQLMSISRLLSALNFLLTAILSGRRRLYRSLGCLLSGQRALGTSTPLAPLVSLSSAITLWSLKSVIQTCSVQPIMYRWSSLIRLLPSMLQPLLLPKSTLELAEPIRCLHLPIKMVTPSPWLLLRPARQLFPVLSPEPQECILSVQTKLELLVTIL